MGWGNPANRGRPNPICFFLFGGGPDQAQPFELGQIRSGPPYK
jgi:hypothetical protein